MELLRYLFLLGVIAGCTSIGFILSRGYADRLNELNSCVLYIRKRWYKISYSIARFPRKLKSRVRTYLNWK